MPTVTPISAIPPDFVRSTQEQAARVRERQQLGTQLAEQAQRALGQPQAGTAQAQLTAASLRSLPPSASVQAQTRAGVLQAQQQAQQLSNTTQQQPLELAQRLFSDRQATLRDAALQRAEVLRTTRQQTDLRAINQGRLIPNDPQVDEPLAQRGQTQEAEQRVQARQDAQRQDAERLAEQDEAERAQAQEDADRLDAQRDSDRADAARLEQRQLDTTLDERAQTERVDERVQDARRQEERRVQTDAERSVSERAAQAYRSESERAVAEANTRPESARSLNAQLQLARERLDALEAARIDRVDVSSASLSRIAY